MNSLVFLFFMILRHPEDRKLLQVSRTLSARKLHDDTTAVLAYTASLVLQLCTKHYYSVPGTLYVPVLLVVLRSPAIHSSSSRGQVAQK